MPKNEESTKQKVLICFPAEGPRLILQYRSKKTERKISVSPILTPKLYKANNVNDFKIKINKFLKNICWVCQEYLCEFKTSLVYVVSSRTAKAMWETLSLKERVYVWGLRI